MWRSARIRAVEIPVPDNRAQPGRLRRGRSIAQEAADGPLASLVIAVQHIDHQEARIDAPQHLCSMRMVGLADRRLPEARVAGGNVQVTRLRTEVTGVRTRHPTAGFFWPCPPRLAHGAARA